MIIFNAATIAAYGFLSAAILAIWLPESINKNTRIPIWAVLLAISCIFGVHYAIVEFGGVLYLLGLNFACILVKHQNKWFGISAAIAVIVLVAGLFLHRAPFFNNPLVFDNFLLSNQASAYSQYWNYDKAAAGLILLAHFGDVCRSARDWKAMLKNSYRPSILTIVATISLSLIFGYIRPDTTIVIAFFAWAWSNLIFTCIAEEMFFRGFIQKHLLPLSPNYGYQIAIVIFVGALFGCAHLGAGMNYVILASVAGIGYGYSYFKTGRIESAILTHFFLNSSHFLFFTYPFAKDAL